MIRKLVVGQEKNIKTLEFKLLCKKKKKKTQKKSKSKSREGWKEGEENEK